VVLLSGRYGPDRVALSAPTIWGGAQKCKVSLAPGGGLENYFGIRQKNPEVKLQRLSFLDTKIVKRGTLGQKIQTVTMGVTTGTVAFKR